MKMAYKQRFPRDPNKIIDNIMRDIIKTKVKSRKPVLPNKTSTVSIVDKSIHYLHHILAFFSNERESPE